MIALLTLSLAASAATVEVNPGDDIRTLTAALGAGSEIVFNGGTYTIDGTLEWTGVGTADSPIVLRAADGAVPIIEITGGGAVAHIYDAQFLEVRGLVLRGEQAYFDADSWYNGVRIENSSNILVQDNEISQTAASGISIGGSNSALTIVGNHIHTTRDGNGIYVGCGDASCWTQDSEIRGNWIHDLGGDWNRGIILEPGSQAITVADNVVYRTSSYGIETHSTEFGEPNTIEGNAVWSAVEAGIQTSGASIIRNNLVFAIDGRGIRADNDGERPYENVVITHNTIANTTDWGIEIYDWNTRTGMVLANNVVANPTGLGFHTDEGHVDAENYLGRNVISGYVEGLELFPDAVVPGAGFSDFGDAVAWDFYPVGGSDLIDAGDPAGSAWVPTHDFNGMPRDGEFPDVGAYEVVATTNPGWAIREGFKELTDGVIPGTEVGGEGCCGRKDNAPDETDAAVLLLPALLWWRRRKTA